VPAVLALEARIVREQQLSAHGAGVQSCAQQRAIAKNLHLISPLAQLTLDP